MNNKPLAIAAGLAIAAALPLQAAAQDAPLGRLQQESAEIAAMRAQIAAMQQRLDTLERSHAQAIVAAGGNPADNSNDSGGSATASSPLDSNPATADTGNADAPASDATTAIAEASDSRAPAREASEDGIKLGGAVRFQYSHENYSDGNHKRHGDMDFDIFRLDLNGSIGNVELSAQYRWFQYMGAIHHAWVGYSFNEQDQGQIGITRVPFGIQPFASHSYFFSSNYYLGLEDAYQMGALYTHAGDKWNVQLGFFKNDSMGGVDGFVSNRADSYTYNVVGWRAPGEGNGDDPLNPIGVADTGAARVGYTFDLGKDATLEVGASALRGGLESSTESAGHYDAQALHANANLGRWNLQLQTARYAYHVDGGADRIAVGAYDFFDSIAAKARSHTGNIAYRLPVSWGPVTALTFYNDYTRVARKSGNLPDTWMNVTGMSLEAGGLFTYFDYVTARNQPFIGGSMADDGGVEHRFNVNFGYYF